MTCEHVPSDGKKNACRDEAETQRCVHAAHLVVERGTPQDLGLSRLRSYLADGCKQELWL
jgi:hypothetical protein